jgi:PEP-CTERM motif
MKKILIVSALAVLTVSANAVDVVAANLYANTPFSPASGLNTVIRDTGQARTAQLLINQNQLGGMTAGSIITGMAFRLWNGATSTYTGATWTSYDIRIGESVAPNLATTTFASNFVGGNTLVQTGALTMSGFTSGNTGATPNAWQNTIAFTTPHVYTGGHLLIEIRHTGSNITNPANTFAEAVTTAGIGYGTDYRSFTATGNTATTGAQASFTMTKLSYTAVPEPATMAALGLGVAALLRRRRSK